MEMRFKIVSGSLDSTLSLSFVQHREKASTLVITGKVALNQFAVTDLDTRYWTQLANGRFDELHPGSAKDPHIRVSAASDDVVEMIDGNKNLFSSYLSGHIKIQASLSDLLSMRKLL